MATLTSSTFTRSTRIVAASRPRLTMPLSRALEGILVSGGNTVVSTRPAVPTHAAPSLLAVSGSSAKTYPSAVTGAVKGHNHKSITTTDAVALLDSRKPCGAVDDQGAGMSRKGAFVISLGSRPPSPPVL
jgi:hypothetical protein